MAAAKITALNNMNVSLGKRRFMFLFSNGVKAREIFNKAFYLTLIHSKNRLQRIKHKCNTDHNSPDTHTRASHPKHEESHEYLF